MIKNSSFLIVLIILIVIPIVLLTIFVALLLIFHMYLIISGKTTKETISKNKNKQKLEELKPTLEMPDLKVALFTGVDQETEAKEEKKPYLCFAMPLTKEEVDYLNGFELCYGSIVNL